MVKRFGLLLTVVGAMLLACAGVVLAQPPTSRGQPRSHPCLPRKARGKDAPSRTAT